MRKHKFRRILKAVNHYLIFFLLVAFVITCCMMLFVSVLSQTMEITMTDELINKAAKLTFVNVIFLSLIFTVIDYIRRKYTVDRPIKKILEAAKRITDGDFTVRIKPVSVFFADDGFNNIIECFNHMAEELSGIETLRTDFIANVSHELKTPLAIMQNYGTMLQTPGLGEEKRLEYSKGITDASRRLASLITNILKLNKLENQQIFPTFEKYNLSEQICECLLLFESQWEKKNINIETSIDDDVIIYSDKEMLSHVWNNLFSNAIKFSDENGCVNVSLAASGNKIVFKVTDNGCGMTPEVGKHIFEKFYQGDTSHASGGNGLGLALVKRVMDIVHGTITVESIYGKGSTFTVELWRNFDEEL